MFNRIKITQYIFTIAGTGMLLFFLLINVVYFYPYNIVDVKHPIEIINKNIQLGGILYYQIVYNKSYNIPVVISQQLITEISDYSFVSILFEPIHDNLDLCHNNLTMSLKIPKNINPGRKIKLIFLYKIFWGIREIKISRESATFNIIGNNNE